MPGKKGRQIVGQAVPGYLCVNSQASPQCQHPNGICGIAYFTKLNTGYTKGVGTMLRNIVTSAFVRIKLLRGLS